MLFILPVLACFQCDILWSANVYYCERFDNYRCLEDLSAAYLDCLNDCLTLDPPARPFVDSQDIPRIFAADGDPTTIQSAVQQTEPSRPTASSSRAPVSTTPPAARTSQISVSSQIARTTAIATSDSSLLRASTLRTSSVTTTERLQTTVARSTASELPRTTALDTASIQSSTSRIAPQQLVESSTARPSLSTTTTVPSTARSISATPVMTLSIPTNTVTLTRSMVSTITQTSPIVTATRTQIVESTLSVTRTTVTVPTTVAPSTVRLTSIVTDERSPSPSISVPALPTLGVTSIVDVTSTIVQLWTRISTVEGPTPSVVVVVGTSVAIVTLKPTAVTQTKDIQTTNPYLATITDTSILNSRGDSVSLNWLNYLVLFI
ncbi:hypothetical protein EDD86DRAFT_218957 [Gorgonomyces haynaldii]|nr:hypothetical protein EDD86DRAFT_218957 [Gorgonomyces haynaldii]